MYIVQIWGETDQYCQCLVFPIRNYFCQEGADTIKGSRRHIWFR